MTSNATTVCIVHLYNFRMVLFLPIWTCGKGNWGSTKRSEKIVQAFFKLNLDWLFVSLYFNLYKFWMGILSSPSPKSRPLRPKPRTNQSPIGTGVDTIITWATHPTTTTPRKWEIRNIYTHDLSMFKIQDEIRFGMVSRDSNGMLELPSSLIR